MENPNNFQGNGAPQNGAAPQPQPQMQSAPQQPQGYGLQPPQGYGPQPQQPQQQPMQPTQAAVGKSSTVAGLLGIFLGWTGAHCFYLGYKQLAIIHLVLGAGGFLLAIVGSLIPVIFLSSGSLSGFVGSSMIAGVLAGIGSLLMTGSGVWGFVEGIMCFSKSGKYGRDANGTPLV
ncbi:MAG: TM2 domain-containing protein [Candidatus Saccharimonadales bacterium]